MHGAHGSGVGVGVGSSGALTPFSPTGAGGERLGAGSQQKKTRPGLNATLHHVEAAQPSATSLAFPSFGSNVTVMAQRPRAFQTSTATASEEGQLALGAVDASMLQPMSKKERAKADRAAAAKRAEEERLEIEKKARAREARAAARQAKLAKRSVLHCQCCSVFGSRIQAMLGLGTAAAWALLNPVSTQLAKKCISM